MDLIDADGNYADISNSLDELIILKNALNEVCNELDQFDFETRLGAERSTVAQLLAKLGWCIDEVEDE